MHTLPTTDRRYLDGLGKRAGWALKRSAPQQKNLAHALGLSESRISRICSGENGGVFRAFFVALRKLAAHSRTDAGHLIAEALVQAVDAVAVLPVAEIRRRLYAALQRETDAEAEEDRAEYRLAEALGRCGSADATPRDFEALDAAMTAWEEASEEEIAWQLEVTTYARALREALG